MYSQWGIIDAKVFKANAELARLRNQLVKLDTDGTITPDTPDNGGLFFPVKQNVTADSAEENVDYQLTGVASVFVESDSGIVAGNIVIVGPNGVGVVNGGASKADLDDGDIIVGIALLAAADLNEIPVLLQPEVYAAPEVDPG